MYLLLLSIHICPNPCLSEVWVMWYKSSVALKFGLQSSFSPLIQNLAFLYWLGGRQDNGKTINITHSFLITALATT